MGFFSFFLRGYSVLHTVERGSLGIFPRGVEECGCKRYEITPDYSFLKGECRKLEW
jgi:hypothetical protein